MPKYQKVLIVPDIHAPFQDELALSACFTFAKWFKPDRIFILGDLVDFYAISSFTKDPERALKLQEEIDEAKNILEQFRKFSSLSLFPLSGEKHFIKEENLSNMRFIVSKNTYKVYLVDIENFVSNGLKERDVIGKGKSVNDAVLIAKNKQQELFDSGFRVEYGIELVD